MSTLGSVWPDMTVQQSNHSLKSSLQVPNPFHILTLYSSCYMLLLYCFSLFILQTTEYANHSDLMITSMSLSSCNFYSCLLFILSYSCFIYAAFLYFLYFSVLIFVLILSCNNRISPVGINEGLSYPILLTWYVSTIFATLNVTQHCDFGMLLPNETL